MSFIEQLKTAGTLTFFHDYRSGVINDWSGNNVDFTVSGTHSYGRDGRTPLTTSSYLSTTDNSLDFDASEQYTFAFLTKYGETAFKTLFRKSVYNTSGFYCIIDTSGLVSFQDDNAGARYERADTAINLNQINSVIITYNNQTVKMYINGVESTLTTNGSPVWRDDTSTAYTIGDAVTAANNMLSEYGAALHISRAITASEAAQLHSELINTKWVTKSQGRRKGEEIAQTGEFDSSLVGSYNLKPVAEVVVDRSGNNNDMSIFGDVFHTWTPFGDGMDFLTTANNYLNKTTFNNLPSTAITVSAWTKTHANVNWNDIVQTDNWPAQAGTWILYTNSAGRADFGIAEAGSVQNLAQSANGRIVPGYWNHIVGTYDGTTVKVYVDGVIGPTTATVTQALDTVENISIAQDCQQIISSVKIYNEAKDQAWVTEEYQRGAKIVTYQTDWYAAEIDSISAGQIGGTDFEVKSGAWSIGYDDPYKILTCASNGYCTVPPSGFNSSPTEAAYGTWEFTLKKVNGAGGFLFVFIASDDDDWNGATQNGYTIHIDGGERVRLRKITNGTLADIFYTNTGFVELDTYYTYRITRSNLGEWTGYILGGAYTEWTLITPAVGTNPSTDNTFTTASYLVFSGTTDNVLALGSLTGDGSVLKRVGVYNG